MSQLIYETILLNSLLIRDYLCLFKHRISLCRPAGPEAHYVRQAADHKTGEHFLIATFPSISFVMHSKHDCICEFIAQLNLYV